MKSILVMLAFSFSALASSVTLAWNASLDPTVSGYNIYYGGAAGNYTNRVLVGNSTNATISGLVGGATYYFAATTMDTYGIESQLCTPVGYTMPSPIVLPFPVNWVRVKSP